MKTDVLDTLFDARDSVSDLIILLSPQNPDQRDELVALLQRRDRITGVIQRVIEVKFQEATDGLSEAISGLETATKRLAALQKTMANVAQALNIVDEVVQAATTLIKIASVV